MRAYFDLLPDKNGYCDELIVKNVDKVDHIEGWFIAYQKENIVTVVKDEYVKYYMLSPDSTEVKNNE